METPVNRSCPGWRSKVRAALAALGGATSGTSRGGMLSVRGGTRGPEQRRWGSGSAVSPKGEVGSQPERGGAVNLDIDVGYSRRRCGWQIVALPNKMSPSSITT